MDYKKVLITLAIIGVAYYGFDKWKRRNNKIVKEGSFIIEVEPYENNTKS
ncbi:MAG: hypothetical protein ACOVNU_09260 [Candidatus Kapaibacteriota bacterium]